MKYLAGIDYDALQDEATPKLVDEFGADFSLADIVGKILPYVFSAGGIVVLLMLVFAGYQYMTSQGDPKAIAAAQQKITWAIVGFLVLFSSYWIAAYVAEILDVQILKDIFADNIHIKLNYLT